jgi:hypothetical protein
MRFAPFAVLFCSTAEIDASKAVLSAFIRPHARFLIQSVVPTLEGNNEFAVYMKTASDGRESVDAGSFCQAPVALLLTDKSTPLTLWKQSVTEVEKLTSSTHVLLESLAKSARGDDSRRADDFVTAWDETILKELDAIKTEIEKRAKHFQESAAVADELGNSAGSVVDAQLLPSVDGKYAKSASLQNEDVQKEAGDATAGALSHDPAKWASMREERNKIKGKLDEVVVRVQALSDSANQLMLDHLKLVHGEEGFRIKIKVEGDGKTTGGDAKVVPPAVDVEDSAGKGDNTGGDLFKLIADATHSGEYKDFNEFITKKEPKESHPQRLAKLTSALNILQMRRVGLMDAQTSLMNLLQAINVLMQEEKREISDTVTKIKETVSAEDTKKLSDSAVMHAMLFHGVEIQTTLTKQEGSAELHLDDHMAELAKFVGKDFHSQFVPQLNLIINVLWRQHAHIHAFVETYSGTGSGMTLINGVPDIVGKAVGQADSLKKIEGAKAIQTSINVANNGKRAGADCLLYGRVDSILRLRQLKNEDGEDVSEPTLCTGEFHELGRNKMTPPADIEKKVTEFETALKTKEEQAKEKVKRQQEASETERKKTEADLASERKRARENARRTPKVVDELS